MRFGIRYQLLVPLIVLLLGVAAMSLWAGLSSAERERERINKQMTDLARSVHKVTIPKNPQTLRLIKGMSGAELLLCDRQRQPLPDDRGHPLMTLPRLPDYLPEPDSHAGLGTLVQVGDERFFCRGSTWGSEESGAWLYIFYPESVLREAVWQATRPALIFGLVGGLAAFLLSVAMAHRITRRIQQMERRTRLIAAGDFSPMQLSQRVDELRDLGQSINDMASQLAQFQERATTTERLRLLGQVSGGLAHQLRNGITGAKLAVQLHARSCPDRSEEEDLQVALRQLALLEVHLKRFLDLGRALDVCREPVDLLALIEETVQLVRPQCRHFHIDLEWTPPTQKIPVLAGDRGQLGQMLLNLITNAIEATGPGGTIRVELSQPGPDRVWIRVEDTGSGPDPAIRDRLFEPFATGKKEGVGLGLAVARQVARAHSGDIAWGRENDRTWFRVEIACTPLAA